VALIAYRSSLVTQDTYDALRRLEQAAKKMGGVKIQYKGVSRKNCSWEGVTQDAGPIGLPAPISMRPTGREIYLSLKVDGVKDPMRILAILWSLAVPLGFVPWDRYPTPSATDRVFHYLGPWRTVGEFLQGEGRGEVAWPSMCGAAQCEAKTWDGERLLERQVQTHLHRLGVHCGPVDGEIGSVTLSALSALGLAGLEMVDVVKAVARMKVPRKKTKKKARKRGHVVLDDVSAEVFTSGGIHTVRTRTGYSLTVDGPGRMILMVGE